MKARFLKGAGSIVREGDIAQRYNVIAKPETTDKDWIQFWTWIKYELRIDYNSRKKIVGCKKYDLRKIKEAWNDKFWFET